MKLGIDSVASLEMVLLCMPACSSSFSPLFYKVAYLRSSILKPTISFMIGLVKDNIRFSIDFVPGIRPAQSLPIS
jgi:hypothetical protein